ncbi:beta-galactosidase trimerization domain-containing protein (plasmid) [Deinococcus sp. KNUC1210]|uniref:beta-galactosidase trimerization domain-containing protein n=1 Tax=Deinococcus sp. KNUC1210 TaxID=2917691 RepID=UPI001EEF8017|nr:glycosyl hydrolase [Deinococcus sp. KNUC1210]ULH18022.1 beta-galactosidase trimerization domain-containing protein [Deinococcus sp. KNUC1210]
MAIRVRGGFVTREPRFRARHLLFTTTPYSGTHQPAPLISNAKAARFENGTLLARYRITFEDGRLVHVGRLASGESASKHDPVWYAYLEVSEPSPWWNNQTYVDTLNPAATARFIEITHERYREVVGHEFGRTIPAIFTDEPQFVHKTVPGRADDTADLFLPWTDDFAESFARSYGHDLLDSLPEVFWERADGEASVTRYRYHDHLAERFAAGYADVLGGWCEQYGLMLTGHMMEEPTLESQTRALGEAMRSYRSFHLPGIDILCDRTEYATAKQASSAARQYGRPGVLSELYGVTNWDFDFKGHKAQGDWQAALGVTTRVHHLAWVSMAGEAKRDYPASIFEQSPWWQEYRLVEDHFARLNAALTRGRPVVRVGVIHPIESYWLSFGPTNHTGSVRESRETEFGDLTSWLLHGLIDFDFVAESLLPDLCPEATAPLAVGEARYDVIIVPHLATMRESTMTRLERFVDDGGTLLFSVRFLH